MIAWIWPDCCLSPELSTAAQFLFSSISIYPAPTFQAILSKALPGGYSSAQKPAGVVHCLPKKIQTAASPPISCTWHSVTQDSEISQFVHTQLALEQHGFESFQVSLLQIFFNRSSRKLSGDVQQFEKTPRWSTNSLKYWGKNSAKVGIIVVNVQNMC